MGKVIKFLDIYKQDKKTHNLFIRSLKDSFKKTDFILGSAVNEFEEKFSKYCSINYSVGCANGTDALYLALKTLNLPKGSEVIVPAMTWISTVLSIINCGLKPVLVDVDIRNSLISIEEIKKKINTKTRVILPVHLYGGVVDIKKIKKIISRKKIFIIEDAAQAHGALDDDGNQIGKFSDLACFSFYPGKNLGCYGDGGMIITNSNQYYKKLRKLRNLGSENKHKHDEIGINSRLDTIQAKLLILKLQQLTKLNQKRKNIAELYDEKIINNKINKIKYSKNAVYHQYVILIKNRNALIKLLNKNNIQSGIHYPVSINKLKCFKNNFKSQTYPNAEKIASECLSLPIDPNLNLRDLNKICSVLNNF
tara:strand:+ start:750 stop:1844 length:1095 start_codon:yes stop_codon:yes gene_type:complete